MKRLLTLFIGVLALQACKPEDIKPNPALYGKWNNASQEFQFNENGTYIQLVYGAEEVARMAKDSIFVDSINGTYKVDDMRNNITFTITSYKQSRIVNDTIVTDKMVNKERNGGVWNYSISNNILTYNSITEKNKLYKIK